MNDEKTLHIKPPKRIEQAGVFVLSMLGLFLLFEFIGAAQALGNPPAPNTTITVSGTGQVALAPDIAHITFTAQDTETTAAAAQTAAAKQANDAIAYVKQQGVADKDITTLYYNISPQYAYPNCPPGSYCPNNGKITGYQVQETVQVTVRDLDKVSTLISGLGQMNVGNLSGPNFTLESPTAGPDAARAQAIANAKAEAQTEAKQLGVSLGRIVSFSEGSGPYPVAYGMGGAAKASDAIVPNIPAGQNTYTDTVSITYAIH